jgi:hypothetical protein
MINDDLLVGLKSALDVSYIDKVEIYRAHGLFLSGDNFGTPRARSVSTTQLT